DERRFSFNGPYAVPGDYTVTLNANGQTRTAKFHVRADPRTTATLAQLKSQQDVALALRELASRATQMLEQTDGITRQLASIDQTLKGTPDGTTADSGAVQQGATVALQAVGAARTKLKTFRDVELARP